MNKPPNHGCQASLSVPAFTAAWLCELPNSLWWRPAMSGILGWLHVIDGSYGHRFWLAPSARFGAKDQARIASAVKLSSRTTQRTFLELKRKYSISACHRQPTRAWTTWLYSLLFAPAPLSSVSYLMPDRWSDWLKLMTTISNVTQERRPNEEEKLAVMTCIAVIEWYIKLVWIDVSHFLFFRLSCRSVIGDVDDVSKRYCQCSLTGSWPTGYSSLEWCLLKRQWFHGSLCP